MTLQEFSQELKISYATALKYYKLGIIKGETIPPKSVIGRNVYNIPESEIEEFPKRVQEYKQNKK